MVLPGGSKLYAVCASADLGGTTGSMQYRVRKGATLEFVYPPQAKHPKGLFVLELLPRGASLYFQNGEFQYTIYEPLSGAASIDVARNGRALTTITCSAATDGLTLTTTQEFLSGAGVYNAAGKP